MADAETIKEFVVALGYKHDDASQQRVQSGMKATEQSAAQLQQAMHALQQAANQVAGQLDSLAGQPMRHLEEANRRINLSWENLRKQITGFGLTTTTAVAGFLLKMRDVGKSLADLGYAAQRTGATAKGLQDLAGGMQAIGKSGDVAKAAMDHMAAFMRQPAGEQTILSFIRKDLASVQEEFPKADKRTQELIATLEYFQRLRAQGQGPLAEKLAQQWLGMDPDTLQDTLNNLDKFKQGIKDTSALQAATWGEGKAGIDKQNQAIADAQRVQKDWNKVSQDFQAIWQQSFAQMAPHLAHILELIDGILTKIVEFNKAHPWAATAETFAATALSVGAIFKGLEKITGIKLLPSIFGGARKEGEGLQGTVGKILGGLTETCNQKCEGLQAGLKQTTEIAGTLQSAVALIGAGIAAWEIKKGVEAASEALETKIFGKERVEARKGMQEMGRQQFMSALGMGTAPTREEIHAAVHPEEKAPEPPPAQPARTAATAAQTATQAAQTAARAASAVAPAVARVAAAVPAAVQNLAANAPPAAVPAIERATPAIDRAAAAVERTAAAAAPVIARAAAAVPPAVQHVAEAVAPAAAPATAAPAPAQRGLWSRIGSVAKRLITPPGFQLGGIVAEAAEYAGETAARHAARHIGGRQLETLAAGGGVGGSAARLLDVFLNPTKASPTASQAQENLIMGRPATAGPFGAPMATAQAGGVVPIQAHAGEMVLPRNISEGLQGLFRHPASQREGGVGRAVKDLGDRFNDVAAHLGQMIGTSRTGGAFGRLNDWVQGLAGAPKITIDNIDEFAKEFAAAFQRAMKGEGALGGPGEGEGGGVGGGAGAPPGGAPGAPGGPGAGVSTPRTVGGRLGAETGTVAGRLVGQAEATWKQMAPTVVASLQKDLGLSKEQAAGVVGNLGVESGGFTQYAEAGGRGPGVGWAQWTSRDRKEGFLKYARDNKLDPRSPEANYGYLVKEMQQPENRAYMAKLRSAGSVEEATHLTQVMYERPGIPHAARRHAMAREALGMKPPEVIAPEDIGRPRVMQAQRGGLVPTNVLGGLQPIIAHAGEMVLPQALSQGLQRLIGGYGGGGLDRTLGGSQVNNTTNANRNVTFNQTNNHSFPGLGANPAGALQQFRSMHERLTGDLVRNFRAALA
jgi:hypothetical protein